MCVFFFFLSCNEKDTESFGVLEGAVQLDEKAGPGIAQDVQGVFFAAHLFAFLFPDDLLFFANLNWKKPNRTEAVKTRFEKRVC